MVVVLSLLLALSLQNSTVPAIHNDDGRTALPDTAAFRDELAAFRELSTETRTHQAELAADVFEKWLPEFDIDDGEVDRGLAYALIWHCYQLARTKLKLMAVVEQNFLSDAIMEFSDAVVADPTNLPLRVTLGMVLVRTGRPREGIDHLEKALMASEYGVFDQQNFDPDEEEVLLEYLRFTAYIQLAFGYRDLGRWELAMQAAESALAMDREPVAQLIKGLCLAGMEETVAAMTWAEKMPPLEFRRLSAISGGYEKRPSSFANNWIKSQALFAIGDLDGAFHVLGELDLRYHHRMPLGSRFWQEAGMIAELRGDPEARQIYSCGGARAFLGFLYPSTDVGVDPLILGFPSREIPFFVTPDGGFEGGTPFGYLVEQMNIMSDQAGAFEAEQARVRALDMCDALLARGVQPDLVTAFRARVYLVGGQDEFAHQDLVYAQAGFASRQLVDPGTSILLGQQELLAGNNVRAEELFREALEEIPDNALAWRELGVALGRARQYELAMKAMDKALELEPDSMEGWFNMGVLAYRRGAYDDAISALEKAWSLEPGVERVQKMLQVVSTARREALAEASSQGDH